MKLIRIVFLVEAILRKQAMVSISVITQCLNLFPLIPACTGRPGLPLTAPDIDFLASPSRRL